MTGQDELLVRYRTLLVTAVSLLTTVRYRFPLSPTVASDIDFWLKRVAAENTIPRGHVVLDPATIKDSFYD
jgi:hypothetical protein